MRIALPAAIVVALLAASCTAHPPAVRPYPPPTPEALLAVVAKRQQAVHAINARVRATSWIGGDRLRAGVLMLVERSGRLRFEAEISLQGTVATLTTDAGRFQLLDARKNELQRGPACPANVASMIRIPLAPAEVAAILLGDARLPEAAAGGAATAATVEWDADAGADVLSIKDGARETRVLIRASGAAHDPGDIVGASAAEDGRRLWRASYEDLKPVGDPPGAVRFPSLIRFAEKDASFDDGVEIKVKDVTLNPTFRPEDFTIAPPAGTRVIDVGCGP
jgi:hypothetical protein